LIAVVNPAAVAVGRLPQPAYLALDPCREHRFVGSSGRSTPGRAAVTSEGRMTHCMAIQEETTPVPIRTTKVARDSDLGSIPQGARPSR
jgi:hypothetical protein